MYWTLWKLYVNASLITYAQTIISLNCVRNMLHCEHTKIWIWLSDNRKNGRQTLIYKKICNGFDCHKKVVKKTVVGNWVWFFFTMFCYSASSTGCRWTNPIVQHPFFSSWCTSGLMPEQAPLMTLEIWKKIDPAMSPEVNTWNSGSIFASILLIYGQN